MKNIIVLFASALFFLSADAHMIVGTPVLKGSLKTKVMINGVKTTCKIKIEDIKNLKFEDSYGNPGYTVRLNANLSGSDTKREISIRFSRDFVLTNMFQVGANTEVKDYEYASDDGVVLKIKTDGRLKSVMFPYQGQNVTCQF